MYVFVTARAVTSALDGPLKLTLLIVTMQLT
jgi:hypothetical protein